MSGLEPVGRLPELKHISRRTLPGVLGHLRASTGSVLRVSFFLTNQMRAQLHYAQLNGTLPILYAFLARSGKTITDVALPHAGAGRDAQALRRRADQERAQWRQDRLHVRRRQAADALLLQHRRLQRRPQEQQRLPQVLRAAGHRRCVREERVLSDAQRQLLDGARLPADAHGLPRAGRHRRAHPLLQSPTTGSCARSAAISGRSACSAAGISGSLRTSSARTAPSRSHSASAIVGDPTSPICCWQPGNSAKLGDRASADRIARAPQIQMHSDSTKRPSDSRCEVHPPSAWSA